MPWKYMVTDEHLFLLLSLTILLIVAITDVALSVALLTMSKGLHIMYRSLVDISREIAHTQNFIAELLRDMHRNRS